jgi:KDO2-lipid IV(A) lauroyltransferase
MTAVADRAEFYALRGFLGALDGLPWETACRLAERIGVLGYTPLRIRRRVVERQIAAAFPELNASTVRDLARRSYRHLARSTVETARLASMGAPGVLDIVSEVTGWEVVEDARALGRGIVVVAGHLGNWELAAAYLAARGISMDVIVRRMSNRLFDRFLTETREKLGMHVVWDTDAVQRAPRALREGRAVGFVADQGVRGLASTFVPFFGRPAKTPRGAAVFALRFDAPVVFVTALRRDDGKYHFAAERVVAERSGDRETDTDAIVRRFTEVLEQWIRRAPEQYFWHHRRWRRQPPETPTALRDPVMVHHS